MQRILRTDQRSPGVAVSIGEAESADFRKCIGCSEFHNEGK